jgi:hypothetical protein
MTAMFLKSCWIATIPVERYEPILLTGLEKSLIFSKNRVFVNICNVKVAAIKNLPSGRSRETEPAQKFNPGLNISLVFRLKKPATLFCELSVLPGHEQKGHFSR